MNHGDCRFEFQNQSRRYKGRFSEPSQLWELLNLEWYLYYEHIDRPQNNTSFWCPFQIANLVIYPLNYRCTFKKSDHIRPQPLSPLTFKDPIVVQHHKPLQLILYFNFKWQNHANLKTNQEVALKNWHGSDILSWLTDAKTLHIKTEIATCYKPTLRWFLVSQAHPREWPFIL